MKRVLAIVLCVMMVGSVFAMAISANAAVDEDTAPVAAAATDELGEPVPTETTDTDETVVTDETAVTDETTAETTAETTTETVTATDATTAPTTAATTAPTTVATADQKKPSPKTGDNMWLWIGIGIFGVALVAIIITFVVKKKAK